MITVAVDCMGGDHGPAETLPACAAFLAAYPDARLLLVGLPEALAQLPAHERPTVTHQSGEKMIAALRAAYAAAGVDATLTPFIQDTAQAFADADVVIARAGASTVTELAAVGAAAIFVPFPHAVDDHQTHNARFLVDAGAAWLLPQTELSPERLAQMLRSLDRSTLLQRAQAALAQRKTGAVESMVQACEALTTP